MANELDESIRGLCRWVDGVLESIKLARCDAILVTCDRVEVKPLFVYQSGLISHP